MVAVTSGEGIVMEGLINSIVGQSVGLKKAQRAGVAPRDMYGHEDGINNLVSCLLSSLNARVALLLMVGN